MRIALFISLIFLIGCDTLNRWQNFSAACKGGEDCERFKKSLKEWEEDLKKRPNYEQLVSEEGIDENKNGLRDDVEIYIDDHLEALKGRHWMAKHPFKMYGAILEYYSQTKPTKANLKQFNSDQTKQIACKKAVSFSESLIGNQVPYINAKIRYLILNSLEKRRLFDEGYLRIAGQVKNYPIPEIQIFSELTCNVPFEKMGDYKDKIFLWGGKGKRRQLQIELMQYEKHHGKKYRNRYKEYLK